MKRYHLLRSNRELGPFSLRELASMQLVPTDLLWVEGESTCWSYPTEIEEVRPLCGKTDPSIVKKSPERKPLFSNGEPVSEPVKRKPAPPAVAVPKPSFDALARKYAEKSPQRRVRVKPAKAGTAAFGLVIFVLGIFMLGFVVKDAVNKFSVQPPLATAEAQEINSENLVQSEVSHAAYAGVLPATPASPAVILSPDAGSQSDSLQAQSTSATLPPVAVQSTKKTTDKKTQNVATKATEAANSTGNSLAVNKETTANDSEKNNGADVANSDTEKATKETEQAEKKPTDAKLQLSANDYKTGFLGGVNGLELTVKNPSAKAVDKATIAVEYLKPNGKVVHTQTVEVRNLDAGEAKKVEVPNSSRGVSVRYYVVNR